MERSAAGESQTHRFAHLHLIDARQHVFHRVFHRDDLAVGTVDEMQAGIKRGGFAGTGWAGDEEQTVRQTDQLLDRLLVVRQETQFRQTDAQTFLVQNTHHDGFPVIRRQTRDAQVNQLAPAHGGLDAPVLRNAMLRDGHVGLDLEPRDDGRLQPLRRALHLVHHAVNAIPQPESLRERFKVNIRRAHLERINDDLIHQLDQRRIPIHRQRISPRRNIRRRRAAISTSPRVISWIMLSSAVSPRPP
jgi:hypothetical protein